MLFKETLLSLFNSFYASLFHLAVHCLQWQVSVELLQTCLHSVQMCLLELIESLSLQKGMLCAALCPRLMVCLWRRIAHFIKFVKDSFQMRSIINLTDNVSNGFTLQSRVSPKASQRLELRTPAPHLVSGLCHLLKQTMDFREGIHPWSLSSLRKFNRCYMKSIVRNLLLQVLKGSGIYESSIMIIISIFFFLLLLFNQFSLFWNNWEESQFCDLCHFLEPRGHLLVGFSLDIKLGFIAPCSVCDPKVLVGG